jgi:hypothetical protein
MGWKNCRVIAKRPIQINDAIMTDLQRTAGPTP